MKKFFCLFLTYLLVALIFTGCNSNNSEDESYYEDTEIDTTAESTTAHVTAVPDGYIGIYTVDDFDYLRNSSTGQYILMNDIDMTDTKKWDGINFQGTFDGNNYEIKNYHFNNGFFDTTIDATISNLTITANIKKTTYEREDGSWTNGVGVLANSITTYNAETSTSSITNCKIKGEIHNTGANTFGPVAGTVLPGYTTATVTMSNIVNEAKIICEGGYYEEIGGIVGEVCQQNSSDEEFPAFEITNAVNKGDITIKCKNAGSQGTRIGGIIGLGYGNIQSCDNYGKIEIDCPVAEDYKEDAECRSNVICGGIVGSNGEYKKGYSGIYCSYGRMVSITSCANYGSITSANCEYAGGIIGYTVMSYDLSDCGNFSSISCVNAGGIQSAGCYFATLNNCINVGTIDGTKKRGAIICDFVANSPEPQNCYYLNNGVNCVGVKAAFPNVYSIEENQLKDSSAINLGEKWTTNSNGPVLNSTVKNSKL